MTPDLSMQPDNPFAWMAEHGATLEFFAESQPFGRIHIARLTVPRRAGGTVSSEHALSPDIAKQGATDLYHLAITKMVEQLNRCLD